MSSLRAAVEEYGYGYGILFNVGEPLALQLGAAILGAHQKKQKQKNRKISKKKRSKVHMQINE